MKLLYIDQCEAEGICIRLSLNMSVSLRFPTYLSDIIVSKGVGHLQPNWNFSLSNGSLSINLTWNNVPTENLILSPPPIATTTHNQVYSRNAYVRPYNVRENKSFCPWVFDVLI